MYPDLSYVFHDILGTAPDNWLSIFKMFGMMLIVSFLSAAYFFRLELIRKEKEGLLKPSIEEIREGFPASGMDLFLNGLFGFFFGFKIPHIYQNFANFKLDPAAVLLSGDGNWGLGLILGIAFAGFKWWDSKRKQLDKPVIHKVKVAPFERVVDITVIGAVSGVIGAKLFTVIESADNWRAFVRDPLGMLLSGSGLAVWGGIILGVVISAWYVRRKGLPILPMLDAAAPAIIVGYGVGRIGCQLSGDGDWGVVNTAPVPSWWFLPDSWWAWDYPRNVLEQGDKITDCVGRYCYQLSEPVFPTPIYETFMCAVILAIMWALRKKLKPVGAMFALYLILNGIERFYIEKIRVNPDISIFGIEATQAEYVAVVMILLGIIGMIWSFRRHSSS